MDVLIPAIYQRLAGDTELTTTLGAGVYLDTHPDDPKVLTGPRVVLEVVAWADRDGLHGASVLASIGVDVWGYQERATTSVDVCLRVCQRLDELFLERVSTNGVLRSSRPFADPGWLRNRAHTDARVVHLENRYDLGYWSPGRVAALS